MDLLPSTKFASEKNAARMVLFAEAAYFDSQETYSAARLRFENEFPRGRLAWWNHQGAAGIIYVDDDCIVIGVASVTSPTAVQSDNVIQEQQVSEWSDHTGIPVPNDARDVATSADYLGRAKLIYMGIEIALHEHFSLTLSEMSKPMWIAGHSVGGAAIQVLQCTTMYSHARAYVYGSPKVFVKHTLPPERLRVSIRRLADPTIYLPYCLRHASAETFYVSHPGSLRSKISWDSRPFALAYAARAWLSRDNCPAPPGINPRDSVRQYQQELWPLR